MLVGIHFTAMNFIVVCRKSHECMLILRVATGTNYFKKVESL